MTTMAKKKTVRGVVLLAIYFMLSGSTAAAGICPGISDGGREKIGPLFQQYLIKTMGLSMSRRIAPAKSASYPLCEFVPPENPEECADFKTLMISLKHRAALPPGLLPDSAEKVDDKIYIDLADASDPGVLAFFKARICPLLKLSNVLKVDLEPGIAVEPITASTIVGTPHIDASWMSILGVQDSFVDTTTKLSVAIVDTTVLRAHQDMPPIEQYHVRWRMDKSGNCIGGQPCCPRAVDNGETPTHYADEHGTMTAGMIAAVRYNGYGFEGLSVPTRLIAIDPYRGKCGLESRVATAIRCSIQQGANIVNLSIEGFPQPTIGAEMAIALEEAATAKEPPLIVVAAGNSMRDLDTCPLWPASSNTPNQITATTVHGINGTARSVGIGKGTVDLAAPIGQVNVLSTGAKTIDSYKAYNHTSAAAAIVSGVAGAMWRHPNFVHCTASQISSLLMQFAEPAKDPETRANLSPFGGVLHMRGLQTVARDRYDVPIDYCVK